MGKFKWCVVGEEGVEFVADTKKEAQAFIDDELDKIFTKKLFRKRKFRNQFDSGVAYKFNYDLKDTTKGVNEAIAEIKKATLTELLKLTAKNKTFGMKLNVVGIELFEQQLKELLS